MIMEIVIIIILFIIGRCIIGSITTQDDIEPDTEDSIRKRNPNMTDQEIEWCLEYEADYWDIDINTLKRV